MPLKSIIDEEVATHFPFIFLLAAFCPIGWVILVGASLSETPIDVYELDDDE